VFQSLNLRTLGVCCNDLKDMKQQETAQKSLKESNWLHWFSLCCHF